MFHFSASSETLSVNPVDVQMLLLLGFAQPGKDFVSHCLSLQAVESHSSTEERFSMLIRAVSYFKEVKTGCSQWWTCHQKSSFLGGFVTSDCLPYHFGIKIIKMKTYIRFRGTESSISLAIVWYFIFNFRKFKIQLNWHI